MTPVQPSPSQTRGPPLVRGLSLAADVICAPFLLGLAGAVFIWGYDGLGYGLGLGAGIVLLQLLIAPVLPQMTAGSIPELFAVRFASSAARISAALAVVVSMMMLLVAQLMAGGLVLARLLGTDGCTAIVVACAMLVAAHLLNRTFESAWLRALVFVGMLIALLAPTVQLSADWYGLPIPQFAYGTALPQIQSLEETLLEQELADPSVMKPMLTAFVSLDPLNFLGLILGVALGLAALPSVLARHFMGGSAREARWSAVWALLFAGLLLTLMPALAAYAKLAVLKLIAAPTPLTQLPDWIYEYGRLGLVQVCGVPALDAASVSRACAALPDAGPALRLQDLALSPDMVTLAAPEITGLASPLFGAIAAAALAAFLVTADAPLAAIVGSVSDKIGGRSGLAGCAVIAVVIAMAAYIATTHPASILEVATWALMLAACALFPALVVGLWWSRASAAAATVAVLAGLAVCLHYLLATRYLAPGFYETWETLSSAGPTAREIYGELKNAWVEAAPGPAKDAAWAALDAHAQGIANWWGVERFAAVLLALPVGALSMLLLSLVLPTRRAPETAS